MEWPGWKILYGLEWPGTATASDESTAPVQLGCGGGLLLISEWLQIQIPIQIQVYWTCSQKAEYQKAK